ncbi:hypothetical protein [Tateyamaria sp. syn59]|uniref:hypothetical protein n=1 Tax=Tateyamaria sp. syn59 TaxID=2576942 RepID=UPI00167A2C2F|nr:hypothetical protein [Tateyamaria sp. syn59]
MSDAEKPKTLVWLDAVSKLVVIFGAAFAVWQFLVLQEDQRVARTLAYLDRLEGDTAPAGRALRALSTTLLARESDLRRLNAGPVPETDQASVHARFAQIIVAEAGVGTLFELDRFFASLSGCLDAGLCHKGTAALHFTPDACWLLRNFQPEIDRHQAVSPRLGFATERVAALDACP